MKLNPNIEKEVILDNKREQLIDAEFGIMSLTGKISGNVKDILYLENLSERKENVSKIKENLGELFVEMIRISDALRLNFDEIIKEKISE